MHGRSGKLGPAVLSILILTGALVAVASPGGAWHTDHAVAHERTQDGSLAYGVAGSLEERADVGIGVTGWAPSKASQLSGGVAVFDQDRNLRLLFAFTAHGSPDRTTVTPSPTDPTPAGSWEEGSWRTHLDGDPQLLEDHRIHVEVEPSQASAGPAEEHPVLRIGLTSFDVEPGPLHRIAWVGEVGASTVELETDAPVSSIDTETGPAHVLGDPEIQEGSVNVQVQDSRLLPQPIGLKVMQNASVQIDTQHGVFGFWSLSDWKRACAPDLGGCLWASNLYNACLAILEVNCGPGEISWRGPSSGADGHVVHALRGTQPGPHVFTVDRKVDLYGPSLATSSPETTLAFGEHYSFLTLADVDLPSPG